MTISAILLSILNQSIDWNDIYSHLLRYNSPQKNSAGRLFEEFCKSYYLNDPTVKYEYKNVWLFFEVPPEIKAKLNLGKKDHGVDLVLEDQLGKLAVVQCKFRSDQNSSLSWSKDQVSNLFADGCNADYFIVFTNASRLDKHSTQKKPGQFKLVALGDLLSIPSSTINAIITRYSVLIKSPINVKSPRKYQLKAMQAVIDGFKKCDRGQLILPCGTGKTLVSLWIKEALNSKHTLVLVPSLALLRQIKYEWDINKTSYIPYISVCSEKDINQTKDRNIVHIYEIPGKVTTNPDEILFFLRNNHETIIYSTYQSFESICNAVKGTEVKFDLAICDEAHKTSGGKLGKFGLIHSNLNIQIRNRLYMTATPRILSDNLKKKLNEDVIRYIHDMSNQDLFGPEFYRMSFKEAIKEKYLVDYKIIATGIKNQEPELVEAIEKRRWVYDNKTTVDEIANNYALEKFMKKYKATHAITFHSSVQKAKSFQSRHESIYPDIPSFHINGDHTTSERNILMETFECSPKSVMTNARCLTEGVDVPAIDMVYFCDPKNSKIDIIQAIGRALRRADHKNKKLGYIVVPILHRENENIEDKINISPFKELMSVIRALCAHDERLADIIKNIKMGIGEKQLHLNHLSITQPLNLITIEGFEEKIQRIIFDEIVSKIQIPYREFNAARSFIQTLGLQGQQEWHSYVKSGKKPCDIPTNPHREYKNKGWISYGDWLGNGNVSNKNKVSRPFNEARKFVHTLKLKGKSDWYTYVRSGNKPSDIPSSPHSKYKTEWKDWGDWLGTYTTATYNKSYLPFEEARKFAHTLNLNTHSEWKTYCKSGNKSSDIPSAPNERYKDQGWKSWPDWLGKKRTVTKNTKWRALEEARKYVHALNLKNKDEWDAFTKLDDLPNDIPKAPQFAYKNMGWISWPDWLGTDRIANQNRHFLPFELARKFAHSLRLKTVSEWNKYAKSELRPDNIPYSPNEIYEEQWCSWPDWLGTKIG